MPDINRSEKVRLKYEDDKVKIIGTDVKAVLELSSSELKKMYFGKDGEGTIHVQIKQD
jgi:hypothetical protein